MFLCLYYILLLLRSMQMNKNKIQTWYKDNLGKIVLVFIILVIFTLTTAYIPYLNVLFSPLVGFLIVFLTWYFLFYPPVFVLVYLGIAASGIALIATLLELSFLSEALGEFIYILLILIVINFIKEFASSSKIK